MPAPFPETLHERAELYANALDEVRRRLQAIAQIQQSKAVPPLLAQEFCHLMLRLACECFAVGCLAAQGDFATHKAFREEYNPALIFKALDHKYPDFFPTPALLKWLGNRWHLELNVKRPVITRTAFETLWNKSGNHLHRASAKRYVKRTNAVEFEGIRTVTEEIWSLIGEHAIPLAQESSTKRTLLHVAVDRGSDDMTLAFLHLDSEHATIAIEHFNVVTAQVP